MMVIPGMNDNATQYTSHDGEWRVSVIKLNGQELLRIECRSVENAPVHYDGPRRAGLVQGPGSWFWVADVKHPVAIEEWVPLTELEGME